MPSYAAASLMCGFQGPQRRNAGEGMGLLMPWGYAAGDLMAGGAPAQPAASSAGGLLDELSGLSGAQPNGHAEGAAGNAADMFGGLSFTGKTF